MVVSESASFTISPRGSTTVPGNAGCTVVWLRGEHDIATQASVVVAIARAAQRDEADLLIDLSEVTFMDASIVGALVRSRNRLAGRSQSLQLRAPSRPARRVLELCGLAHLVQGGTAEGPAAALGTWVDVVPAFPKRSRFVPTAHARPANTGTTAEVDRGGR